MLYVGLSSFLSSSNIKQVCEVRGERGARLARVPRHGRHLLRGAVPHQLRDVKVTWVGRECVRAFVMSGHVVRDGGGGGGVRSFGEDIPGRARFNGALENL